jgi:transposase
MDYRKIKGIQIARAQQIRKTEKGYIVPSQSGKGSYVVSENRLFPSIKECTCQDYELRKQPCKHIFAVQQMQTKGTEDEENASAIQVKRMTYKQDWQSYTKAQVNEKDMFLKLLYDLCQHTDPPAYRFGRPQLPLADMVFSSALKVYTGFSLRRFMSDMRMAKDRGCVENECSYVSVSNYMRKEELTPVLHKLVALSAQPLKTVEENFAIDSSGFRTTKFNDYMGSKYNILKEHDWLKLHICTGVKTNIITAVQVDRGADSPQFIPLTQHTADSGFIIKEMSADKAYNSVDNYNAIQEIGGTAYIPFKSNATGQSNRTNGSKARLWRKMFHYFQMNQEDFLNHYHSRSNVESTINMVKAKFSDLVRSKDSVAQENELLLKVLCHNIVVLIHESFELGIDVNAFN